MAKATLQLVNLPGVYSLAATANWYELLMPVPSADPPIPINNSLGPQSPNTRFRLRALGANNIKAVVTKKGNEGGGTTDPTSHASTKAWVLADGFFPLIVDRNSQSIWVKGSIDATQFEIYVD